MKTSIYLLILIPLLFVGCTKNDSTRSEKPSAGDAAPEIKSEANQEQIEKDLEIEEAHRSALVDNSPNFSDAEAFRFSNEAQRFTLTKLGSVLNSEFQCQATLKLAIREKEEKGQIKLSFGKNDLGQNEFKAVWWPADASQKPFYIANKKEVCGEKIETGTGRNGATKKAIGSLVKISNAKVKDQYVLQYTVYVLDPVSLKMKWFEDSKNGKSGEMTCVTLSQQAIAKATIESCQLLPAK